MGIAAFLRRMGPAAVLAVGAALVGVGTALAAGPGQSITVDFEGDRIGTSPSGFSVGLTGGGGSPAWKVVEDRTAPSGSKAVAETSGDPSDYRTLFNTRDGSFTASGKAGLWTKADSLTHFDDLQVRALP